MIIVSLMKRLPYQNTRGTAATLRLQRVRAWWLVGLLPLAVALANDVPETETTPDGLGLLVAGTWDEASLERVRAFVQRNTSVEVRIRPAMPLDPFLPLESLHDLLNMERDKADAAWVVLYAGDQDFEPHTVYNYEVGVAVVNLAAIATDIAETELRRIEKLTIRSFGLLLDVPMVPNPHSALWTYRTLEELDFMGRNFDPPSLIRFQQNAAEMGIPLIENHPFLLHRE